MVGGSGLGARSALSADSDAVSPEQSESDGARRKAAARPAAPRRLSPGKGRTFGKLGIIKLKIFEEKNHRSRHSRP